MSTNMIEIDGSKGEGGGQILRTSLSLAAITGQAFRLFNIRAGRKNPGLAAQHLTSVRAAAAICQGEIRGDQLGSMMLEFTPTCFPQGGDYIFDVTEARQGGSAGAVTLILQTVLIPLALAKADSTLILKGGTHVAWSPPVTYIEKVYLPILKNLGLLVEINLKTWGWYPIGGGEVELQIKGNTALNGLQLLNRGEIKQVTGLAVVTELPSHIPQRMVMRAEKLLQKAKIKGQIEPLRLKGVGMGAGIFLSAEYENTWAGFSALGKRGLAAENVAQMAVQDFLNFHQQDAPVDEYLGDQLLLPLALANSPSQYRVAKITHHLQTNIDTISQFGIREITLNLDNNLVSIN